DQSAFARLAASVRAHVNATTQPLEVTLFDPALDPLPPPPEEATADPELPSDEVVDSSPSQHSAQAPSAAPKVAPTPDNEQPEAPPPDAAPAEKEPATKERPLVEAPNALPRVGLGRRVSVQQRAQDKNRPDNPHALYQADEANRVAEDVQ